MRPERADPFDALRRDRFGVVDDPMQAIVTESRD